MTRILIAAQATIIAATLYAGFAHAEGKVIARKDLPAAVQGDAKKESKFPGIPSCAKGRLETNVWPESASKTTEAGKAHKCADAQTLYVCVAFGKLSVRCE